VHNRDVLAVPGVDATPWGPIPAHLREAGTPDRVRTADLRLDDWRHRLTRDAMFDDLDVIRVPRLVSAGVCLDDIAAWSRTWGMHRALPDAASSSLATDLGAMWECWPAMTLRDAVGWTLLGGSCQPGKVDARDLACTWGGPGRGWQHPMPGGWWYAAAGLTWDETQGLLGTGSLDEDAVAALVALRGAAVPAGTHRDVSSALVSA
jgi:hypothetical protein